MKEASSNKHTLLKLVGLGMVRKKVKRNDSIANSKIFFVNALAGQ